MVVATFIALLDLLAERLHAARVDAVVDRPFRDNLPNGPNLALKALLERGRAQGRDRKGLFHIFRRDPLIGIELDLNRREDLEAFAAFAPYSTNAVAFEASHRPVLQVVDSGDAIIFEGDDAFARKIAESVGLDPQFVRPARPL